MTSRKKGIADSAVAVPVSDDARTGKGSTEQLRGDDSGAD